MNQKCMHIEKIRQFLMLTAGTAFMAVGIKSALDPMELVTGGFTGISILIKHLTSTDNSDGIPLWLTNLFLNIPLFIAGKKIKGKKYFIKSLYAALMLSFWLNLLPVFPWLDAGDVLLSSLAGGVFCGLGAGIIFRTGACSGGTELLAAIIQKKIPYYSIVPIVFGCDILVVILGAVIFGIQKAGYALIALFVVSKISDTVLEGFKESRTVYIITEKEKEIANLIAQNIKRGITGIRSFGYYSRKDKNMLFCVVSKKEIVDIKELVMQADKNAFLVIGDALEVYGEGFLEAKKEEITGNKD